MDALDIARRIVLHACEEPRSSAFLGFVHALDQLKSPSLGIAETEMVPVLDRGIVPSCRLAGNPLQICS